MRKVWLPLAALTAIFALIFVFRPVQHAGEQLPAEHLAFRKLVNEKVAQMRSGHPVTGKSYSNPEMFFLFDAMKRMDPSTGMVPDGALLRAWEELEKQFGNMPAMKTNFGLTWTERGPTHVGGRTRGFLFDPNDASKKAAFAGGVGGGLWKNNDIINADSAWSLVSPVFSNVAVTCIGHDPNNTLVMYYGTGEGWFNADAQQGAGLWKTTDGGNTWDHLSATDVPAFRYSQKIIVNSNGHLFVATKGGLHKSTDGGASFTKVLGSGVGGAADWITDMELGADGDLYAAVNSLGIYKSHNSHGAATGDAGKWNKVSSGIPSGFGRIEIAVAQSDTNRAYVLLESGNRTDGIYKTTNGGSSWSAVGSQPNGGSDFSNGQAWYDLCIEVDPADENHVLTGAINVFQTTDAGGSWERITDVYGGPEPYIHPDQHGIYFRAGFPGHFVITNDGGHWMSMDGGVSFVERNNNYAVTQFYSMDVDQHAGSNIIIGGTQDNGTKLVNAPGLHPGTNLTGADGSYCNINFLRPDTMYTTYQYATVLRTRDGGANFSYISNPALDESNTLFINPIEMDPNNPDFIYQASTALWRHNNAGSGGSGGWVQGTKDYFSPISAIGISKSTANLIYFSVGGTIYRFPNGHAGNFTSDPPSVNPSGSGSGYVNCIAVDPNDGNHIIITKSSYGVPMKVVETRNAQDGASAVWKNLTGNLPDLPVTWAIFEPNNPNGVLIGTDLGVFRCADITAASADVFWSPERNGMGIPRVDMMRVRYSDNTVYAATHGRGFFSSDSYNFPPVANFGLETDTVCGGEVRFVDSTVNAPNSWAWDFGDGGISSSANPLHTYSSSGTYTVTLIVSNPNGADTVTRTVTIFAAPQPVAVASPDTALCGGSVSLFASGGTTYSWFPTAGLDNPTSATPTLLSLTGSRTFVVTITNEYGCSDTESVVITKLPSPNTWAGPDKTINLGDSVKLEGSGADTYLWSPAAGLSCTTCAEPMASPAFTTIYSLTGTNTSGCSSTNEVKVTVITVGVDDATASGLYLYPVSPNPVSAEATFRFKVPARRDVRLEVLDVRGRRIHEFIPAFYAAGEHTVQWNAADHAPGVYFLRLVSESETRVQKFIISR